MCFLFVLRVKATGGCPWEPRVQGRSSAWGINGALAASHPHCVPGIPMREMQIEEGRPNSEPWALPYQGGRELERGGASKENQEVRREVNEKRAR